MKVNVTNKDANVFLIVRSGIDKVIFHFRKEDTNQLYCFEYIF